MPVREEAVCVVAELMPALDESELAGWFASANASGGGIPLVVALVTHAAAVWSAARADRFILRG
jgi:hypothetical protein